MSKIMNQCNGCRPSENGHDQTILVNGPIPLTDHGEIPKNGKPSADELIEQLRAAKKQNILQLQRIEELESYLNCIVVLNAKVRQLELDASL